MRFFENAADCCLASFSHRMFVCRQVYLEVRWRVDSAMLIACLVKVADVDRCWFLRCVIQGAFVSGLIRKTSAASYEIRTLYLLTLVIIRNRCVDKYFFECER